MHHNEQRIFFLRAKTRRLDEQIGNRPPFRTRKLKPLHRRQIKLRHLGIVEVRENLIRTCGHIKARHLGRPRRAIDIRHQHLTTPGQPTHAAILRHLPRLDRASRHRHGKQFCLVARFSREKHRPAVGTRDKFYHRQIQLLGQRDPPVPVKRPRIRHHALVMVRLPVAAFSVAREESLAVRLKYRIVETVWAVRQLRGLAAVQGHREQVRGCRRIGRPVARRARNKHHAFPVGHPRGRQRLARLAFGAAETSQRDQLRARQHIARLRSGLRLLHKEMRLLLVEPTVPILDRKSLIDARVVFPILHRLRRLLVRFVVVGAGKHFAHKKNLLPVRTPLRRPRARREGRHALRFPAAQHIEHIDLRHLVAVTFRGKRDPRRVRAPHRSALGRFRLRELPRRRAAVKRHEPQIRRRVLRLVSRLRHRKCRPLPVRTRHRCAHA